MFKIALIIVIEGNLQNRGGSRQNFEFRWRLRDEEGCKMPRKIGYPAMLRTEPLEPLSKLRVVATDYISAKKTKKKVLMFGSPFRNGDGHQIV